MRSYQEIKKVLKGHEVKCVLCEYGYAHYDYRYTVQPGVDLTAEEMALYVDSGNLCFGGRNFRRNEDGTQFSGTVHTD